MHSFDSNLDHLGDGTLEHPEWRIEERAEAYATRAGAARAGLSGSHGYEAGYSMVWVDADGDTLDGAKRPLRTAPGARSRSTSNATHPTKTSGRAGCQRRTAGSARRSARQPRAEILNGNYILPAITKAR
jgi:hypothetical protein